jgi:hypothetical protein
MREMGRDLPRERNQSAAKAIVTGLPSDKKSAAELDSDRPLTFHHRAHDDEEIYLQTFLFNLSTRCHATLSCLGMFGGKPA